jgi:hypothetical protein
MSRHIQETVKPSTWLRGLKRLSRGLWNPHPSADSHPLSAEIRSLNLGKRAQPTGLYSPADVNETAARYGANCGPASFAALTRRPISCVMSFFKQFPDRPWTNKTQMRTALNSANLEWRDCGPELPSEGLALLQLLGPWCRPGIHPGAALSRTHWVAVVGGALYDINWEGWLPQGMWEQLVFVRLRERYRGCSGWGVHAAFEVALAPPRGPLLAWSPEPLRRLADLQPA